MEIKDTCQSKCVECIIGRDLQMVKYDHPNFLFCLHPHFSISNLFQYKQIFSGENYSIYY